MNTYLKYAFFVALCAVLVCYLLPNHPVVKRFSSNLRSIATKYGFVKSPPPPPKPLKYAIVTYSSDETWKGTVALLQSLHDVKTSVDIIVLETGTSHLTSKYFPNITSIRPPFPDERVLGKEKGADSSWEKGYDLLYGFALDAYDKLLFLDSTRLVLENIDHLFKDVAAPSASRGKCLPCDQYEGISAGVIMFTPNYRKSYLKLMSIVANQRLNTRGKVMDWDKPVDYLLRELWQNTSVNFIDSSYDYAAHTCICKSAEGRKWQEKKVAVVNFGLCASYPWMAEYTNPKIAPCYSSILRIWWYKYKTAIGEDTSNMP